MDVKRAVAIAKKHIADLFAEEDVKNLGLEEVEFDDAEDCWNVTIGFTRPWDEPDNKLAAMLRPSAYARRDYKIVRIAAATEEVESVKNREFKAAA